jgi:tetratricopeptide (TPR) repeat protein
MPDSLYAAVASRPGADAVHGVALYELGTRAYARQEFARAESLLREAATLWDHQPNLHFALGNIAVLLDRPGEAIEEFRREIERDPRHAPSWLNLAACYENAVGDFTAARAAYERYVELGGERSAEIRQRLGTLPPANPPGTP